MISPFIRLQTRSINLLPSHFTYGYHSDPESMDDEHSAVRELFHRLQSSRPPKSSQRGHHHIVFVSYILSLQHNRTGRQSQHFLISTLVDRLPESLIDDFHRPTGPCMVGRLHDLDAYQWPYPAYALRSMVQPYSSVGHPDISGA